MPRRRTGLTLPFGPEKSGFDDSFNMENEFNEKRSEPLKSASILVLGGASLLLNLLVEQQTCQGFSDDCSLSKICPEGVPDVSHYGLWEDRRVCHRCRNSLLPSGCVQCEACHGEGKSHPEKGSVERKVTLGICRNCHTKDRSPAFNDVAYLEKIGCKISQ